MLIRFREALGGLDERYAADIKMLQDRHIKYLQELLAARHTINEKDKEIERLRAVNAEREKEIRNLRAVNVERSTRKITK